MIDKVARMLALCCPAPLSFLISARHVAAKTCHSRSGGLSGHGYTARNAMAFLEGYDRAQAAALAQTGAHAKRKATEAATSGVAQCLSRERFSFVR